MISFPLFFLFCLKERNILCLLPDRCTLPPPVGNRCSRSRLFAFYFWRPPFENSALWHGTTGARGACIKGPWQREVPTHARSVNWLRRFSVAPFGCEAPENLGSGKSFRSSNAFCPLFGALRGNCQKNEDTKITSKGSDCIYCPDCINFKGVAGKIKTWGLLWQEGDFMSVSYYSKGGAPQSLLTPKSWITPKKGSEKAGFTGGCASLQLGSLMQQFF